LKRGRRLIARGAKIATFAKTARKIFAIVESFPALRDDVRDRDDMRHD
jgi:hypothetical protein